MLNSAGQVANLYVGTQSGLMTSKAGTFYSENRIFASSWQVNRGHMSDNAN